MELEKANEIAMEVVEKLSPYCKKIEIAGGIRAGKEKILEIELCCAPKLHKMNNKDSEIILGHDIYSDHFEQTIKSLGYPKDVINHTVKHISAPYYNKNFLLKFTELFIYCTSVEDFYRTLVIRSSTGKYVKNVLEKAWQGRGWIETDKGLRWKSECRVRNKGKKNIKYDCLVDNPIMPPLWESEEDFYNFLGLEYVDASKRTI